MCTAHQNVKLMHMAAKLDQVCNLSDYKHSMCVVMCNPPRPACYFRTCEECLSQNLLKDHIIEKFEEASIEEVSFKQWTTTDRSELLTHILSYSSFAEKYTEKVISLCTHSFIAKMQSNFLSYKKKELIEGEFAVTGDFSENYSFVVQDAAQGFHWNNLQATIHPWVYYYKKDQKLEHSSFTIISENNTHDVISVHLYIKSLIHHLKSVFGPQNVKKLYYFSDGCAGQYKNCKSFLNLCHHKNDFGIDAEWHFFATSHGKGPSDGVGGTIKREAAKESLRRPISNQILTPIDLFNFAKNSLNSTNF